ncbi:TPA: hypothetical protein ACH3X1_009906 [Trebouxia sp. C0004]
MQGQVARCYAETCFQKFIGDNLQRLRASAEADLIREFAQLKLNLRQGFVSTGMGDLQSKLLTVAEAKKHKVDKFIGDNLQRLRASAEADLIREFAQLKLNLRQGFVSTGMGDLQSKLLTVAEAKKHKVDVVL